MTEPLERQYIGLTLEELHQREREYAERVVAERCAPLVEALRRIADGAHANPPGAIAEVARLALHDYHAAQGAGRGT